MNFVPEEIYFVSALSGIRCADLKHVLLGAKVDSPEDDTPTALFSYQVPENFTLLITEISLRSIPVPLEAELGDGDWRADDYDASGTAKAYIQVNGVPVTTPEASAFMLFNRPLLMAFDGGATIEIIIVRGAAALPTLETINLALSGYLGPLSLHTNVTENVTMMEATYS